MCSVLLQDMASQKTLHLSATPQVWQQQSLQASGAQAFTAFLGAACMCDSTANTASLFLHSAATLLTSLIHKDTHASMLQMKVLPACNAYIQLPERTVEHTFLVMAFFALGAAAFLGAVACMPEQRCSG